MTRADADGRDEVIAVDATARRSDTASRSVSVSFENCVAAADSLPRLVFYAAGGHAVGARQFADIRRAATLAATARCCND
ncbi:hypothetical protein ACIP6P_32650 [Streptomyces sp. NPDC088729]|uniref:hypothetical protein n=1 Tax=Streptomyces sp. NPDC088729 TaxID=3365876 RepID=UPI003818791B